MKKIIYKGIKTNNLKNLDIRALSRILWFAFVDVAAQASQV